MENRALNRRVELTIIQGESTNRANEAPSRDAGASDTQGPAANSAETTENPDIGIKDGADTDQVAPEYADESVTESETMAPVLDTLQPVIVNPFAGVTESAPVDTTDRAQGEPEKVTIDIGKLKDKLNSLSKKTNQESPLKGQQK